MIQEHYIYCTIYFYYFYISSTLYHQALDPEGWGEQQALSSIGLKSKLSCCRSSHVAEDDE